MTHGSKAIENLLRKARKARERAYAPYSGYKVGAAILASDGRIFSGANVENASYGLTVCAERAAIFKGVSEGVRKLKAIAIFSAGPGATYPCGACLQVIQEFGDSCLVIMQREGKAQTIFLKGLLPKPFKFARRTKRT